MRIISNTEITSYNICKRQHWYRFQRRLEPPFKKLSRAIRRGLYGHEALEVFYKAIQAEASWDDAKQVSLSFLDELLVKTITEDPRNTDDQEMIIDVKSRLDAYFEFYRDKDKFEVISVEKVYRAEITPSIWYGMKADLVIMLLNGVNRGRKVLWDHKFVYNFKSQIDLNLDAQQPKYIRTIGASGINIRQGVFNQIRTRPIKNPTAQDLFARTDASTSKAEIENIWEEQAATAVEIVENPAPPRRTTHQIVCRSCAFNELCKLELRGEDSTSFIIANFQPSSYGYTDIEEAT
jgi:CRISPR/Cas system-associated exonuclease Cas4 (RecB family)